MYLVNLIYEANVSKATIQSSRKMHHFEYIGNPTTAQPPVNRSRSNPGRNRDNGVAWFSQVTSIYSLSNGSRVLRPFGLTQSHHSREPDGSAERAYIWQNRE